MASEKSFQQYFMKTIPHGYRISLIQGGGFPDCLLIHGDRHSLVELKLLEIGPSGDKKLKGLFKQSQPPWYLNYLAKGGTRLFVVFKIVFSDTVCSYGVLHVQTRFIRDLDDIRYRELFDHDYVERATVKEVIYEIEERCFG